MASPWCHFLGSFKPFLYASWKLDLRLVENRNYFHYVLFPFSVVGRIISCVRCVPSWVGAPWHWLAFCAVGSPVDGGWGSGFSGFHCGAVLSIVVWFSAGKDLGSMLPSTAMWCVLLSLEGVSSQLGALLSLVSVQAVVTQEGFHLILSHLCPF